MAKLKHQKVFDEIMSLLENIKKYDTVVYSIMKDLLQEAYDEYNKGISIRIDKQLYMWIDREIDKNLSKDEKNENIKH